MSRDDVEAEITLDEVRLHPGHRVTLRFKTTADEPVRIRGAHATFVGYERTEATYTTHNGKTTQTHTAVERHVLVEEKLTFRGQAPAGFFHDLADGAKTLLGGGDHVELPRGDHEALLEVDLPADLPESFQARKVRVAYDASIHLDIPAGRDFRHTVSFDVAPPSPAGRDDAGIDAPPEPHPVSLRYPDDQGRGFFDSVFGPDVSMHLHVDSDFVRRGDVLRGRLEVQFPDKPANVKSVVVRLVRNERSHAHGHTDRCSETIATETYPQRNDTARTLFASFELPVPPDAVPDGSGANYTIANELALSLDVPWAKDPTVRVPITVV